MGGAMKLKSYTDPVSFYRDFLNSPGNRFIAGDLYLDNKKQAETLRDLCEVNASEDGARGDNFFDLRTSDYIFVKKGAEGEESIDLHKDSDLKKEFFTKIGTLVNPPRNVDTQASRLASESKIQLEGVKEPDLDFPMQLMRLLHPLNDKLNEEQKRELFGKLKAPLGLGDHETNLIEAYSNRLKDCGSRNMEEKRELANKWKDEIEKHIYFQWV